LTGINCAHRQGLHADVPDHVLPIFATVFLHAPAPQQGSNAIGAQSLQRMPLLTRVNVARCTTADGLR